MAHGKCDEHGCYYKRRQVERGKTIEYCPECAKEEEVRFAKMISTNKTTPLSVAFGWPPIRHSND